MLRRLAPLSNYCVQQLFDAPGIELLQQQQQQPQPLYQRRVLTKQQHHHHQQQQQQLQQEHEGSEVQQQPQQQQQQRRPSPQNTSFHSTLSMRSPSQRSLASPHPSTSLPRTDPAAGDFNPLFAYTYDPLRSRPSGCSSGRGSSMALQPQPCQEPAQVLGQAGTRTSSQRDYEAPSPMVHASSMGDLVDAQQRASSKSAPLHLIPAPVLQQQQQQQQQQQRRCRRLSTSAYPHRSVEVKRGGGCPCGAPCIVHTLHPYCPCGICCTLLCCHGCSSWLCLGGITMAGHCMMVLMSVWWRRQRVVALCF